MEVHTDTLWTKEGGGDRCSICLENTSIMMLIPCGHLCMCQNCSVLVTRQQEVSKKCPVCRCIYTSAHRVFGKLAAASNDYDENVEIGTQVGIFEPVTIKVEKRKERSTVTIEEINELTEGLQGVHLRKKTRTEDQERRMLLLAENSNLNPAVGYTNNKVSFPSLAFIHSFVLTLIPSFLLSILHSGILGTLERNHWGSIGYGYAIFVLLRSVQAKN